MANNVERLHLLIYLPTSKMFHIYSNLFIETYHVIRTGWHRSLGFGTTFTKGASQLLGQLNNGRWSLSMFEYSYQVSIWRMTKISMKLHKDTFEYIRILFFSSGNCVYFRPSFLGHRVTLDRQHFTTMKSRNRVEYCFDKSRWIYLPANALIEPTPGWLPAITSCWTCLASVWPGQVTPTEHISSCDNNKRVDFLMRLSLPGNCIPYMHMLSLVVWNLRHKAWTSG